MTVFLNLRAAPSGALFEGTSTGQTILWDNTERKWYVGTGGGGGGVTSWDGRTGAVVPLPGDYDSDEVDNASTVAGASVSDALESLQQEIADLDSDDVANASTVAGATVSDALETLESQIGAPSEFFGVEIATNAEANTYETNTTTDQLLVLTGSDFNFDGEEFTLTPSGCVVTYDGAGGVFLVSLVLTYYRDAVAGGTDYAAISKNNEQIGAANYSAGLPAIGYTSKTAQAGAFVDCQLALTRSVTLANGDTLRPLFGSSINQQTKLLSLSFSATRVG